MQFRVIKQYDREVRDQSCINMGGWHQCHNFLDLVRQLREVLHNVQLGAEYRMSKGISLEGDFRIEVRQ